MRNASGNWYVKHLTYISEDSYVGTVHSEEERLELEANNVEVEEAHLEIPDRVIKDIRRNDPDRPTFKVVVGDEFGDGHGNKEIVFVRSNLSKEVIGEALGKAYTELPWLSKVCSSYGDSKIKEEYTSELKRLGVNLYNLDGCTNNDEKIYVSVENFVQLHLEVARVFLDVDLEYRIIPDNVTSLELGSTGYGLFE